MNGSNDKPVWWFHPLMFLTFPLALVALVWELAIVSMLYWFGSEPDGTEDTKYT